jgi:4a-hydroxytetrahydrobiopterin dehydratase
MPERRRLTADEIRDSLASLNGWTVENDKLHKQFEFGSFVRAFSFMTAGALIAEKMDHHPEWSNVYNRVVVDLATHDVGGISPFDFDLAAAFDANADS